MSVFKEKSNKLWSQENFKTRKIELSFIFKARPPCETLQNGTRLFSWSPEEGTAKNWRFKTQINFKFLIKSF